MKLDRTTYEAWLLDRIEGTLTPAQERELDMFLAANTDLNPDLHGLPRIEAGTAETMDWKNELKKRLPPTGTPDAGRLNEFLVARMEGDLDAAQTRAVDKFLYEHPQFAQDAKRIGASKADPAHIPFADKPSIQRHFPPEGMPDKYRLTDFLIAAHEGDLTTAQRMALSAFLAAQPDARRQERLVAVSRVVPDRIIFSNKHSLKKKEVRVIALWHRYAAAASIALLLGFAWWATRTDTNDGPVIADAEKVKPMVAGQTIPQSTEDDLPREPVPQTLREGVPEVRATDVVPAPQVVKRNAPAPVSPERRRTPPTVPDRERSDPLDERSTPFTGPTPGPQFAEAPVGPVQQPPDPRSAHKSAPEGPVPASLPVINDPEQPALASNDDDGRGGTPIGTVLANRVRNGMLATERRESGLDRADALTMANKAIGAVTGGQGSVEVAPKGGRSGWKLRLGQHLAISASTGR